MTKNLSIVLAVLLGGILQSFAGDTSKEMSAPPPPQVPVFRAGGQEVELLGGALVSIQDGNRRNRPALDYSIEAIRYGWMLNDIHGSSFWRGNDELLLEAFAGEVFKGPKGDFGGGMLILRHNFVQDNSRIIPYVQIGGGGLGNDIFHNQTQTRIGEEFEFTLHGGLGIRWMITDHWALSTEGEYRHISNAGLASRNSGLDSFGGTMGLNYLF